MPDIGHIVMFEKDRLVVRPDKDTSKWGFAVLNHACVLQLERHRHVL